ncbi:RHS repeat-associated core domain-containing protein [Nonomuraea zeae]|uniref:Transcriptional regulator n=1 Tax=Nonomuraea zeae TaxID=1642303 RepID=A0A5S4GSD3_9ACTN|nr:RHS repeat-associated core domain-containing protein [Nonomuraea zeae]TMR35866.1 transcriptional regulator [Nonomuraea zeae]
MAARYAERVKAPSGQVKSWRATAPVWPARGVAEVEVSAAGATAADKRGARAGDLPVWVDAAAGAAATADGGPAKMRVESLGKVETAGAEGLALRMTRADGQAMDVPARLTVDYSAFRFAYGGDWASRLRVWRLPECALRTPKEASCQGAMVTSVNDVGAGTVSAQVTVPGSAAEPGATAASGTLLAVAAEPSGSAGDYKATSLAPSATWSAEGNSGNFSWSYPVRVPPGLGGPQPAVTLGYSADSVDGRTAAVNSQPSWAGEGFDWHPGFIERRYIGCAQDMAAKNGKPASNKVATGDLCWATDNAVLSMQGHAGELIKDASGGDTWRLRADDGTRIERRTGAANGDDDGEWWLVTTTDGTQYWFGGRPGSQSALTVPVFGNHEGERCYRTTFAASSCTQAYRWQLDHVVDPHGNTMRISYTKETNRYGRNLTAADAVEYDRAGYPQTIEYGTRGTTDQAPMRVSFGLGDRCLSACGENRNWPDVPLDLKCSASPCGYTQVSPSFWMTKRLASVTTQVLDPGIGQYADAESWTLTHAFPAVEDYGTPAMWLASIAHKGLAGAGADVAVPEVRFTSELLSNRVDTREDTYPAMNRHRIKTITDENGGVTDVVYAPDDCVAGSRTPDERNLHDNAYRCYPVRWTPAGKTEAITDFFHKHVVQSVTVAEVGTGSPTSSPKVTTGYTYNGTPAWHYSDDDGMVKPEYKTWSVWRGYSSVTRTVGEGAQQMRTEKRYFRGMHGDKLPSGTRVAELPAITANGVPSSKDEEAFAGRLREAIIYDGQAEVSAAVSQYTQSEPTASRTLGGVTVHARMVHESASHTRTTRDGARAPRTTTTTRQVDGYRLPTAVDERGDDNVAGDEKCTLTEYARDPGTPIVDSPSRVRTFAADCATAKDAEANNTLREEQVIAEERTSYDHKPWGQAPSAGDVTQVETIGGFSGGKPSFVVESKADHDDYGRVTDAWDVRGAKTGTVYTPKSGGPVTSTTVTGPLGWVTTTEQDPVWGEPTRITDPNDRVTDLTYDAMGRLTAVWLPGRDKTTYPGTPSSRFSYLVRNNAATVVTSQTLSPAGDAYDTTHVLYDALMRERQTQTSDATGGTGAVVTDTFYDSAGRAVRKNNPYLASVAPKTDLIQPDASSSTISAADVTVYDGAGRVSAEVRMKEMPPASAGGTELWRSTHHYGGDREDLVPPGGGIVTSTVSDATGHTVELRQYRRAQDVGTAAESDKTAYTYNAKGQLTRLVDAEGNTWQYGYDLRGKRTRTVDPDTGTTVTAYNAAGDLITKTDNRGETVAYTYDVLGRPTSVRDKSVTGDPRVEFTYDTLADGTSVRGRPVKSVRYAGTGQYVKEIKGYTIGYQPSEVTHTIPAAEKGLAGEYTYKMTYYASGLPKTMRLPAAGDVGQEELTFGYTTTGEPTTLSTTLGATLVTNTRYTSFNELGTVKLKNSTGQSVDVARTYDTHSRRLAQIATVRQQSPTAVADLRFGYDGSGNVTEIADQVSKDYQCFTTDHLKQVREAWTPATEGCGTAPGAAVLGGPAKYWHTYDHDAIGNRVKTVQHATSAGDRTTTYSVPAAHKLTAVSTGSETSAYAYDSAGNVVSRPGPAGTQTLTWDPEGELAQSVDASGPTSYVYDAGGERLIRTDPSGKTLYLPGQELRYTNATGTTSGTRYYTHAGQLIATRAAGKLTWMSTDHHGTAVAAIGAVGQTVALRRQTPFGEQRTGAGTWPATMDKGFVGGTQDPTGLTHLGAREYDPALGRFTSADPLMNLADPQQINGYHYGNQNPVTLSDPDGLFSRSCPDGVCSDGRGGAYQHRASNPATSYNPKPRPWNPALPPARTPVNKSKANCPDGQAPCAGAIGSRVTKQDILAGIRDDLVKRLSALAAIRKALGPTDEYCKDGFLGVERCKSIEYTDKGLKITETSSVFGRDFFTRTTTVPTYGPGRQQVSCHIDADGNKSGCTVLRDDSITTKTNGACIQSTIGMGAGVTGVFAAAPAIVSPASPAAVIGLAAATAGAYGGLMGVFRNC